MSAPWHSAGGAAGAPHADMAGDRDDATQEEASGRQSPGTRSSSSSGVDPNEPLRWNIPQSVRDRLEKRFQKTQYLKPTERKHVAAKLRLTEQQVLVWFQNRRQRDRCKSDVPPAWRSDHPVPIVQASSLPAHPTSYVVGAPIVPQVTPCSQYQPVPGMQQCVQGTPSHWQPSHLQPAAGVCQQPAPPAAAQCTVPPHWAAAAHQQAQGVPLPMHGAAPQGWQQPPRSWGGCEPHPPPPPLQQPQQQPAYSHPPPPAGGPAMFTHHLGEYGVNAVAYHPELNPPCGFGNAPPQPPPQHPQRRGPWYWPQGGQTGWR
mmetsp:Transcript_28381/g.83333  ORF Transcript_28381/g.83333 Transcript_28381/m.83333 type:complete len:316 (-) Transcript_28381:196-1143(-)